MVLEGKGWEHPPAVATGPGGAPRGTFTRRHMPGDNSCLFHSVAFTLQDKSTNPEKVRPRPNSVPLFCSLPVEFNSSP